MNKIFLLLFSTILCSCQHNSKENRVELINNQEPKIKEGSEVLNKRQKLNQSIYVLDSLKLDLDFLIDTAIKYNPDVSIIIHPAELNGNFEMVYPFDDSTLFIPFFVDIYNESLRFTKWKLSEDRSMEYFGRLKPDFGTKYSYVKILEHFTLDEKVIMIGETYGGEGGEIWQNIWASELNDQDSLIEIDQFRYGFDIGHYTKSLEHQIINGSLIIYEKTDSAIYIEDSLVMIPVSTKMVKRIALQ